MKIKLTTAGGQTLPPKHKKQAKLNRLWQRVQNQRKLNDALAETLDNLLQEYHHKIRVSEKEVLFPVQIRLAARLIELFGRKSLSNWHRDEMADWIGHLLADIALQDQEQAHELAEKYDRVIAERAGMSLEELKELQEAEEAINEEAFTEEAFDEVFEAFAKEMGGGASNKMDEEAIASAFKEFKEELFGFAETGDQSQGEQTKGTTEDFDPFDNFDPFKDFETHEKSIGPEVEIDAKWLRQLFRRAAAVLHPDKEQDPEQQAIKQQAMAALLDARDRQDVITMISLYTEHVADGEFGIDASDIDKFTRLLEQQLLDLEEAQLESIHQSPQHHFVYQNLYAKSAKGRAKKLSDMLAEISQQAQGLSETVVYMRNLTRLKEVLGQRNEQRRFAYFDDVFDDEEMPF